MKVLVSQTFTTLVVVLEARLEKFFRLIVLLATLGAMVHRVLQISVDLQLPRHVCVWIGTINWLHVSLNQMP